MIYMSFLWYLDSRDRVSGTNEDFYVELRQRFNNIKGFTLRDIDLPFSYYVFTASHIINFIEAGGELSATLTAGNYTSTELMTHLKSIMDTAGANTYTWTYNNNTSRLTCASTGNYSFLWATGTNSGNGIDELLGFTASGATPSDTVAGTTNTASSVLNTSGENALYLEMTPMNAKDIPYLSNVPKQILCKIPITESPGSVIHYQPEPYRLNISADIDQLRFRIVDRRSRSINLNGKDFCATIEVSIGDTNRLTNLMW